MSFQFEHKLRKQLEEQFFSEFSERWNINNKNVHYELSKITNFTIEEIEIL